jgi:hypothetical protein
MPYLSLVHLRDLPCEHCKAPLAQAGARSFIVDQTGNPVNFSQDDPPAEMVVQLSCPNGHTTELNVPNEIAAEEALSTPDDAPIATDACIVSGMTDSGKELP